MRLVAPSLALDVRRQRLPPNADPELRTFQKVSAHTALTPNSPTKDCARTHNAMAPIKSSAKGKSPKGKSSSSKSSSKSSRPKSTGKEPEGISKRKQKSMSLAKPGGVQKSKSLATKSNLNRKKKRVYTEKELDIPLLNGIVPAGIAKPKGQKKGKTFVDDPASMMAIMSVVHAEKEGHLESKIMRARQLEEIREAKRKEADERSDEKKEKFVSSAAGGCICWDCEAVILTCAVGRKETSPEEEEEEAFRAFTQRGCGESRARQEVQAKEEGFVRLSKWVPSAWREKVYMRFTMSKTYDTHLQSTKPESQAVLHTSSPFGRSLFTHLAISNADDLDRRWDISFLAYRP